MSALEAKQNFGELLDTAQREPVAITKHNRSVGTMYSMQDIERMAQGFLSEPIAQEVEQGIISVQEAILKQAYSNERIAQSREEIASGQGIEMDDTFFNSLKSRVRKVSSSTAQ